MEPPHDWLERREFAADRQAEPASERLAPGGTDYLKVETSVLQAGPLFNSID
ncbi:hypothetical protein [Rhodoferax sediminis]|uniref:hypothetical protein n=1 Tax=Rhodoferax sediminis TaxID=2509614 RepID=UPI00143DF6EF|nr:hypothetical protein [Rhodoferax sediminis]